MNASYTIYFKEIYPSFSEFSDDEYYQSFLTTISVYCNVDVEPADEAAKCFNLILRHYRNSEIAFQNVDDFRDLFFEKLEQVYPNYMVRRDYYRRLLTLTDKELLATSVYISNSTEYTNEEVANPLDEPLTHITNQNSSKSFASMAERLRTQIYNAQFQLVDDFLRKLRKLFIQLGTSSNYV